MATTTVVYPYLHQLSQGDELKRSIRSLCKHLDFDFDVVLIGDKPDWYVGRHIRTEPVRNIVYARAFDIARKLDIITQSDEISEDFVYCYDDIYALTRIGWGYFGKVVALEPEPKQPIKIMHASATWTRLMEATFKRLPYAPKWNYETHLPRMLNKTKLRQLIRDHEPHKNPLLFSTIYYNEYFERPDLVLTERNEIKAGIYKPTSYDGIVDQCRGKLWLNHGEKAWNDAMGRFLKNNYPEPCRYEREFVS